MADKKAYMKQYRLANKEKIKEQEKQYRLANKEHLAEQQKQYYKTENGKKSDRICRWKRFGVISDDFNELYEKYINTNNCDNCDIELIHGMYGSNKKCLDHDHGTGQFRNILCNGCNLRRG
tara:strand:+ start:48 stop:410 length:363 start_codon:yes stop_codon:yes gene_type:complete